MGLKPTIYRTQGEHANHYATDAVVVVNFKNVVLWYVEYMSIYIGIGNILNWDRQNHRRIQTFPYFQNNLF